MTSSWQKENILRATLPRHMRCLTKKPPQQHFRWLRSSTGDVRNIIADRLADCGTQRALQLPWWRRTPNGGREEDASVVKIVSFQRETTPCAGAFPDMWPGPVDVARSASPIAKKQQSNGECRETRKHVPSCTRSYNGGAAESGPKEPVHRACQVMRRKQADHHRV